MATIYQVAERAGVSLSTVSRVLNGKTTVNATLKAKVVTNKPFFTDIIFKIIGNHAVLYAIEHHG